MMKIVNFFSTFILLIFPVFYFSISTDPPINQSLDQNSEDAEIYISSGAMIVGGEHVYHAKIVVESTATKENSNKKAVVSKIVKPTALANVTKKSKNKIVLKPSKPKFVFTGSTPDQNFGLGTKLTNKNSVINPTFVERNDILCHFTVLSVPLYVYLLNIYTADFSKTAELSYFLFSRPPPMI